MGSISIQVKYENIQEYTIGVVEISFEWFKYSQCGATVKFSLENFPITKSNGALSLNF